MYYQSYEDYMRSVLGYPIENQNTYESYQYENQAFNTIGNYSDEIMDLYPEIYKLINPMVCKICDANTKPITRELLEKMTEEIYLNLESVPELDTTVNVRVNTPKPSSEASSKIKESDIIRQSQLRTSKTSSPSSIRQEDTERKNREDRQRNRNRTLQDLIRILILNRLLGINRPPRPRPPRPPFPGPGNPMPRPPRPPFPREDEYYNGLF